MNKNDEKEEKKYYKREEKGWGIPSKNKYPYQKEKFAPKKIFCP